MYTGTGFFGYLCAQQVLLSALHIMLWIALVFNTLSYVAIDQNSATRVIIGFNFVGILVLLVGSGLVILRCRQLADE